MLLDFNLAASQFFFKFFYDSLLYCSVFSSSWNGDKKIRIFLPYLGVSSVVLQKQIKDLHQEQKVLRDTGWVFVC